MPRAYNGARCPFSSQSNGRCYDSREDFALAVYLRNYRVITAHVSFEAWIRLIPDPSLPFPSSLILERIRHNIFTTLLYNNWFSSFALLPNIDSILFTRTLFSQNEWEEKRINYRGNVYHEDEGRTDSRLRNDGEFIQVRSLTAIHFHIPWITPILGRWKRAFFWAGVDKLSPRSIYIYPGTCVAAYLSCDSSPNTGLARSGFVISRVYATFHRSTFLPPPAQWLMTVNVAVNVAGQEHVAATRHSFRRGGK